MRRGLICVGVIVLACSQAVDVRRRATDDEETALSGDLRAAQLEQRLSVLTSTAAPPDCVEVCDLVEQICDLSHRICGIAARHPGDAELAGRCTAGEERCRRSRERVPAACSCGAP